MLYFHYRVNFLIYLLSKIEKGKELQKTRRSKVFLPVQSMSPFAFLVIKRGRPSMLCVFTSVALGLYCSGISVVIMDPVSLTVSSNGLETVWCPISSLCASLNAKTLARATFFSFLASVCWMPTVMTAAPQRMCETYQSVCRVTTMKHNSCKNEEA